MLGAQLCRIRSLLERYNADDDLLDAIDIAIDDCDFLRGSAEDAANLLEWAEYEKNNPLRAADIN